MSSRLIAFPCLFAATFFLFSCSGDTDAPILMGSPEAAKSRNGEGVYQQAKQADSAGQTSTAVRLYDKTATDYPFTPSAAQARFRQAQLLEQQGQVLDSFEAYDKFLARFPGSSLYTTALHRQATMAQAAADGDVKSSFLGLKTKLSLEKTVGMLKKVREHAPMSRVASKAQFTIGQLYQAKGGKSKEAIEAYRQLVTEQPNSPEAPEALFLVGKVYTDEAKRGNQNRANVDLAREAFNDYLIQYPGHYRTGEARRLIANLGQSDLRKSLEIADFYKKTGKTEAAKVYYRDIIKQGKSGTVVDEARASLRELGEVR